jgi:rubrerythrin|tara:strand:- start:388 stop:522 length:135 start_codon:yes stop_codon:yes gene_type:complete
MKQICNDCGYVHDGEIAPDECPVCGGLKEQFFAEETDTRSVLNE